MFSHCVLFDFLITGKFYILIPHNLRILGKCKLANNV